MAAFLRRLYEDREGEFRLTVEEEDFPAPRHRTYAVSAQDYEAVGAPAVGDAIDEETLTVLAEAEGRRKACARAVSILSYGACSANSLYQKLRAKGYDRESAEAAVAQMLARGYINEQEQAERLAVLAVRQKCWGRRRVLSHLTSKGYGAALARRAVEHAEEEGDIDFAEAAHRLLEKRLPPNATPDQKRALLYKYGF